MTGPTVVSRALAVLGCFDADHRHLTLTQVAALAELPMTTAHRLVRELVTGGALVRRPDGGYEIGPRLEALGRLAPLEASLQRAAGPVLADLAAATGATAQLGVLDGHRVRCTSRVPGTGSGRGSSPGAGSGSGSVQRAGTTLPLHPTALGRVLLAHAPADVAEAALRAARRSTAGTGVDPVVLTRQLARMRLDDVAIVVEDGTSGAPGASSVALPVRAGADGDRVVAALGLLLPAVGDDPVAWTPVLRVAARALSRAVGPDARD